MLESSQTSKDRGKRPAEAKIPFPAFRRRSFWGTSVSPDELEGDCDQVRAIFVTAAEEGAAGRGRCGIEASKPPKDQRD